MSQSKELVGPLRFINFGPYWNRVRVAYTPPRGTMDPRYDACFDHHTACDCREAALAEHIDEYRAESQRWIDAARTVLAGHRAWDWSFWRGEGQLACQCHGCQLVRASGWSPLVLGGDYETGVIQPPEVRP